MRNNVSSANNKHGLQPMNGDCKSSSCTRLSIQTAKKSIPLFKLIFLPSTELSNTFDDPLSTAFIMQCIHSSGKPFAIRTYCRNPQDSVSNALKISVLNSPTSFFCFVANVTNSCAYKNPSVIWLPFLENILLFNVELDKKIGIFKVWSSFLREY